MRSVSSNSPFALSRLAAVLFLLAVSTALAPAQTAGSSQSAGSAGVSTQKLPSGTEPGPEPLPGFGAYKGQMVVDIVFNGVDPAILQPLPSQLPQQPNQPLDPDKVRDSLRRLYATGRYDTMEIQAEHIAGGVRLIFTGKPRMFIQQVLVAGVKNDRITAQLVTATKLNLGDAYDPQLAQRGIGLILESLSISGYHEGKATVQTAEDGPHSLVTITYTVNVGPRALVGDVSSTGDIEMTEKKFRRTAKLRRRSKVTPDTTHTALTKLRLHYQRNDHLEAKVTLTKESFDAATDRMNYEFSVERGPIVKVSVVGAKLRRGKIASLVPVFEESAVDEDLLNEGSRHIRDYFQERGFSDVDVTHTQDRPENDREVITYNINLGNRHRVEAVEIRGNKYFDSDTIRERIGVTRADFLERYGKFSQAQVDRDVDSIKSLYSSNGFREVAVTGDVKDEGAPNKRAPGALSKLQLDNVRVIYTVVEGKQSKFGTVAFDGVKQAPLDTLKKDLNTTADQPYSLVNLSGDRETMLNYYLAHGFSEIKVEVAQVPRKDDAQVVDITFKVSEGQQVFINQVLIRGIHYTKPKTVTDQLQIKAGQPLDQSALVDTQRRLYDLALFNEVDIAAENPEGEIPRKNVLLNLTEAKRYDFNYGFGFQAETGNPSQGCPSVATLLQLGIDPTTYHCSPDGKTGASGLVSFDATRINFRGKDETLTLHTLYGSLEKAATLIYTDPHFRNNKNLSFSINGGYLDSQDVTTFASSRLEANVQMQQILGRAANDHPVDTLIYRFAFRRIKVDPNSIQVSADEIPLLSQPARVAGPGATFIRDTRDNPLDAHRGNYITSQAFLSDSAFFSSQSDFTRFDATWSSYYAFGKKRKFILARSTRFAAENTFGDLQYRTIPLPERLFAGGSTSHRGFAINQAGPRDTQTGYPIGGNGAFVNSTELRTPSATLPLVGDNLSFVLFHDVGNAFAKPGEIFSSLFQWTQPDQGACRNLAVNGGLCNFNYMSHALGLGLRYATPIGPIRVDLSDNLNPPVYPILIDPFNGPHVSQLSHFNFFFSIGQSF